MKKAIALSIFVMYTPTTSPTREADIEQLKIGNLALAPSQQMGPLFSVGQTIINKGDKQFYSNFDTLIGCNMREYGETLSYLHGIRDDFALYLVLPIALRLQVDNMASQGFSDLFVQGEWAFYSHDTLDSSNMLTLVGALSLPTGSETKSPPTGFGSPTFLLGFTASHLDPHWYYFISAGGFLPVHHCAIHYGKEVWYQFGFGGNIAGAEDRYIISWLLEFDGTYTRPSTFEGIINPGEAAEIRNTNTGGTVGFLNPSHVQQIPVEPVTPLIPHFVSVKNPNSGGNIIYICPSFWASTPRFILQAGIGIPVVQDLLGEQNKVDIITSISFGITL